MLGIVIVNYKTDDRVIKYVTEELPKIAHDNKIVIINNSATDESNFRIAEGCRGRVVCPNSTIDKESDIFVFGSNDNLGFARGNNIGAVFLLKHFNLDYLLISNCDLVFLDNDVIDKLISKMDDTPDIGLIGPCVINVSGKRESPVNNFSVWKRDILPQLFYPLFGFFRSINKPLYPGIGDNIEGDYDLLNGSIYLLRTTAFVKAGMFDPNTFLYNEEPILAARIKKIGFRVYYFNKVKVIHEQYATVRTLGILNLLAKYSYDSTRYYRKEYQKSSLFALLMFDFSHYVFTYVWKPLFVGSFATNTIKRLTKFLSIDKTDK